MPSKARQHFDDSAEDLRQLASLFDVVVESAKDDNEDPPQGTEALLRSAVVLMVSHWEAYVEDICAEAIEHLVARVDDAKKLPKQIKQAVVRDLKADQNELAVWQLADDGWKKYLSGRLTMYRESRNRSFNTPKAQATVEFIRGVTGIEDVRKSWHWDSMDATAVVKKLDALPKSVGR